MSGSPVLEGGGLRVEFARRGDRYGHVVYRAGQPDHVGWQPVLESIEGTPDDVWPPSPPLQNIHIERRAQGVLVALLVGMAGTSHWSASIELDPRARRLTFDVACRLQLPPGKLGSTYRGSLQHVAVESLLVNDQRCEMVASVGSTVIQPAHTVTVVPDTVRWCYQVCVR